MPANAYGIDVLDHYIKLIYKIAIRNYKDCGADFVLKKLERSYNKLSERGKQIIEPQRGAARLLLKK